MLSTIVAALVADSAPAVLRAGSGTSIAWMLVEILLVASVTFGFLTRFSVRRR